MDTRLLMSLTSYIALHCRPIGARFIPVICARCEAPWSFTPTARQNRNEAVHHTILVCLEYAKQRSAPERSLGTLLSNL